LLDSARRIRSGEVDVESWSGPQQLLPVINNPSSLSGGCGGCGYH
jgi:hypothetical protein